METIKSQTHVGYPFPANEPQLTPAEWGLIGLSAQAFFVVAFFVYVAVQAFKRRKL